MATAAGTVRRASVTSSVTSSASRSVPSTRLDAGGLAPLTTGTLRVFPNKQPSSHPTRNSYSNCAADFHTETACNAELDVCRWDSAQGKCDFRCRYFSPWQCAEYAPRCFWSGYNYAWYVACVSEQTTIFFSHPTRNSISNCSADYHTETACAADSYCHWDSAQGKCDIQCDYFTQSQCAQHAPRYDSVTVELTFPTFSFSCSCSWANYQCTTAPSPSTTAPPASTTAPSTSTPVPQTPAPTSHHSGKTYTAATVVGIAAVVTGIICSVIVFMVMRRRRSPDGTGTLQADSQSLQTDSYGAVESQ